jgi:hypothetical protein
MTNVTDLSHLEFIASQQPETRGTITRSKFELALHTLAGRRFLAEVQRQLWARLPNESRSQVRHQRCEQTALEVFRLEKLVFQPGVTNLFIKYKPKQKFNMWRRAVSKRKTKTMAKLYRWKKNVSFGLYCLMEHVKAKKRKKRLDWLADRHAGKSIQSEESVHRVYGKHCSLTFLLLLSLSNLFHCFCHGLLYFKTPKQVFFIPIHIFDIFYHTLISLLFIKFYFFFHFNVQIILYQQ